MLASTVETDQLSRHHAAGIRSSYKVFDLEKKLRKLSSNRFFWQLIVLPSSSLLGSFLGDPSLGHLPAPTSRSDDGPQKRSFRGDFPGRSQRISKSPPEWVSPHRCRGANLFGCVVAVVPTSSFSCINQRHVQEMKIDGYLFVHLTEETLETKLHVRELAARNRIRMLILGMSFFASKWLIYIWPLYVSLYIVLAHIARSKGSNSALTILIAL